MCASPNHYKLDTYYCFADKSKTKKPEVNQTPKISYETNGYSGNWASDYDDDDESDDINSSLGEDDEKFASQLKGKQDILMHLQMEDDI